MSLSHHVEEVRSAADSRDIELAMNIFVLGEHVPPWVRGFIGADAETVMKHDGRRHSEGASSTRLGVWEASPP